MAYPFQEIEQRWQQAWHDQSVYRAADPDETDKPAFYVLDMFPYPSGSGLHVGHPEGYTATDIVSRYKRMRGFNVLHPMGWDAFGLPAEQYAIKNNVHPAETTAKNVETFRRQIEMLGLGYDWSREVNTTDPAYYKWTQWIFLQIYNSYFDPQENKAMPIAHLENELLNGNYVVAPDGCIVNNPMQEGLEAIAGEAHLFRHFENLTDQERRAVIDGQRLAFVDNVPVNWCPELGTTLANEEVVDGKSEVGGHSVERRPLRQWMLRITAYADRLIDDLDDLQWSDSLKDMQRNWIGKSVGATVEFEMRGFDETIEVYTTRPDTLFGATYMVLAPEHELVARITREPQRAEVEAYVAGGGQPERARPTGRCKGEDRRLHRCLRDQPGERRGDPGLDRRLRADGLRHRRDHGGAGPRRARLCVREEVRPADRAGGRHRQAARRRRHRRRRRGHQLRLPRRKDDRRGQGVDHRLPPRQRRRSAADELQAA